MVWNKQIALELVVAWILCGYALLDILKDIKPVHYNLMDEQGYSNRRKFSPDFMTLRTRASRS